MYPRPNQGGLWIQDLLGPMYYNQCESLNILAINVCINKSYNSDRFKNLKVSKKNIRLFCSQERLDESLIHF